MLKENGFVMQISTGEANVIDKYLQRIFTPGQQV